MVDFDVLTAGPLEQYIVDPVFKEYPNSYDVGILVLNKDSVSYSRTTMVIEDLNSYVCTGKSFFQKPVFVKVSGLEKIAQSEQESTGFDIVDVMSGADDGVDCPDYDEGHD